MQVLDSRMHDRRGDMMIDQGKRTLIEATLYVGYRERALVGSEADLQLAGQS